MDAVRSDAGRVDAAGPATSGPHGDPDASRRDGLDGRDRRRLITSIKDSLRELGNQLSLLNHQVGAQLDLRDVDLDCLDVISRYGPLSPTALARRAGLHPATMTGILDRLQRAGWVVRERDPDGPDRRAVAVRALRDRNAELYRLYSGMNDSMDRICGGYSDAELAMLVGFLRDTANAGRDATDELATS
jgi:DNA-binding MarR family transcriptional regulator